MNVEEHFREILESLNQSVLLVDDNLTIIYSNKSRSPSGKKCHKVSHGFDTPCWHHGISICPVMASLEKKERLSVTHKHLYDGETIVEEIFATPFNGNGYVVTELFNISRLLLLKEGILPICSVCKRIRDLNGEWNQIEAYFHKHTGADFSHSLCNTCKHEIYPNLL